MSNNKSLYSIVKDYRLWDYFYKNNPDDHLIKTFMEKSKAMNYDQRKLMMLYAEKLEESLSKVIGKNISYDGEEAAEIIKFLVGHLSFFHNMDSYFVNFLIKLFERSVTEYGQKAWWRSNEKIAIIGPVLPWVDLLDSENPNFLKENPHVDNLSKQYTEILYNVLVANKEKIIGGRFNVL